MRRFWITGGIMIATGLATWQFVSYAQPPQDRRESHQPDDRRAPPPPPRERDEEELGRALRDESRRVQRAMDDATRNREQAEARLRAAQDELRRLAEEGVGEHHRDSQRVEQARINAQAAEEHAKLAEEHARRMHEEFAMQGGFPQGPADVRREIRIVHGEGLDRVPMTPEEMRRLQDFRRSIQNYRQEKDSARKDELREEIQTQLSDQLNRDVEKRKEQIAALEKRLDRLRQQVKDAEESREETVDNLLGMLDDGQGPFAISPAWIQALQSGPNAMLLHAPTEGGFGLPELGREMLDRFIPNIDIEVRGGEGMRWSNRDDRPAPRAPQPPRRPDAPPPPPEHEDRLPAREHFEDDFKPEIELDEDELESNDDDEAEANSDDASEESDDDSSDAQDSDDESEETEANI